MLEEAILKGYTDVEAILYYSFQRQDNKSIVEEFLEEGYVKVGEM